MNAIVANGHTFTAREIAPYRRRTEKAIARMSRRHSYGYDVAANRYTIREPANAGGNIVATLHGDVSHPMTHEQAEAICSALDKLARRIADMNPEDNGD